MIKTSFFSSHAAYGPAAIPLFTRADEYLEKVASPDLLPEVVRYIHTLRPRSDAQYVLLNAMGAGEFWGSNVNGDYFPEAALIHAPDDWSGNPLLDREKAKTWGYGYPTFYLAHPYAHHRNKDATRAFGEVELALWNNRMKRVELVTRVDKDKCDQFGGTGVWDKLKAGHFPDVSMGCKVPFDTCSICLDWEAYRKAMATFKKDRHRTPGEAILEVHKQLKAKNGKGIRGLSITRADYCEHARGSMNKILSDGRKVFVYNDYPKFFDISFVFIGADKTAKVMMKIADGESKLWSLPSAEIAEKLGYVEEDEQEEKTASASEEDAFKMAFLGKAAKLKKSEIVKDTVPSQFAGKAVPLLTRHEPDLPEEVLDALASRPLGEALSTTTGLGMVLRPKEFQRIILVRGGQKDVADDLEQRGVVFPKSEETDPVSLRSDLFHSALAKLLLPLLSDRSAFGPAIEKRVLVIIGKGSPVARKTDSSHSSDLLRKIGSAYNGYRQAILHLVPEVQDMIDRSGLSDGSLKKLAQAHVNELFTSLSAAYLKNAFLDEVGHSKQANAGVERGLPSRNTWNSPTLDEGVHS